MTRRLTGWGRATGAACAVRDATTLADVQSLVRSAGRGVLARGLGRSYGDAAHAAGSDVLTRVGVSAGVDVDSDRDEIRVGAGVSLGELMRVLTPLGLRLPVLPGTRFVTVGGAVAADIHGKNHHADGSFGRWVRELTLVDGCGDVRAVSPETDPDTFWSTVGGMGLTGVVTSATVGVERLASTLMRVRSRRFTDLDAVMDAMEHSDDRYHVAWVSAAPGKGFGRSVLDEGDHHDVPDERLAFAPRSPVPAPPLPVNAVRPLVIALFNELWWRRAPADRTSSMPMSKFFHPLDGVGDWHRLYGPHGFLQWQIAVPFGGRPLVERSLRLLADSGAVPALVVLKRFGESTPGPLSFPIPGWTLAVDVAAAHSGLGELLDRLDAEVASVGGRVYLAKDARMSREVFRQMYPRLDEWRAVRQRLDPNGVFVSDLGRRLGLCDR